MTYPHADRLGHCPNDKCRAPWQGENSKLCRVQYSDAGREYYDGTSEYQCRDCHLRIGRWTGEVIPPGYIESRFGKRGIVPTTLSKAK